MAKINLPVIVLKGTVLIPSNHAKIEVENKLLDTLAEAIELHDSKLFVVTELDELEESLNYRELDANGVICKIISKIELPGGNIRVTLDVEKRALCTKYMILDDVIDAVVETKEIEALSPKTEEVYIRRLKSEVVKYTNISYVSNSILSKFDDIDSLDKLTDEVTSFLELPADRLYPYLIESSLVKRLGMLIRDIQDSLVKFDLETELDEEVDKIVEKNRKEFYLREQIKIIRGYLGDLSIKDADLAELKSKLETLKTDENIKGRIDTEIKRYETISEGSPEANMVRNYIDWMLSLPWDYKTLDNDDLEDVRMKLDSTHSGIEKVKIRIIEYLAVKQMTNSLRGPIICLVGPPGVGKTSLAFSIANAMNRKFAKISVGGINDETEIIGHRRTYVGSNPGRIISSIKKAGSSNPVFLIDEIDKMLKNYKGDPASTLLEILDPEQNKFFSDNYIEEPYDLSNVMFITTANSLDTIPRELRDRLEIINITGYTDNEKLNIARNYLLPKICKEHGLNFKGIDIKDDTILRTIKGYTREAGVRELERVLATIVRKVVSTLSSKRISINKFVIDRKIVKEYLGEPKYTIKKRKAEVGIANALAYSSVGGILTPIEVSYFKGCGNLVLTGTLGEVMKESALIAFDYIKSNYKKFKIDFEKLENDVHIHVPDGAIPKDGPSSGIAIASAIISSMTNKKIESDIAFSGELTLRGKVLPVGGLREKSIGAKRCGINKIFVSVDNKNANIPVEIKESIEFIYVKDYKEIFDKLFKEQ